MLALARTAIWAFTAAALVLIVFWRWGWLDAPKTYTIEQQNQITYTDTERLCLGAEIWHTAAKETEPVQMLTGQAILNLRKQTKKDICVIFQQGLAMVPEQSVRGTYMRTLWYVRGEAKLSAERRSALAKADDIAAKLLSQKADPVQNEFRPALCATKVVRSWDRKIATPDADLETLKREMKLAYTSKDGTMFFCP